MDGDRGGQGMRRWSAYMATLLLVALVVACSRATEDESGGESDTTTPTTTAVTSDPELSADPEVGPVRGSVTDDGVVAFLGIPYARPPVAELRFQPPEPHPGWVDTLVADEFGPACLQSVEEGSIYADQSEDCLTLNVWTPGADDEARPVMVWIHGGGWVAEGTSDVLYDGGRLAARGGVVVVSMEYRLGVLGFSHLDGLEGGERFEGSGNLGLLDQQLALGWVQDHIADFGGDPENVTLFGESAGAMSAVSHLVIPGSEGLFDRAIAQSGAGNTVRSSEYAASVARRHLDAAGVAGPDEFANLSAEEILAAQQDIEAQEILLDLVYGPVMDGTVLPDYPHRAIAGGAGSDVPLITGTTRDETSLYNLYIPGLETLDPAATIDLLPYLRAAVPTESTGADVAAFYDSSRPDQPDSLRSHAIWTDVFFRIPTVRLAEAREAGGSAGTYLYRFDWAPPMPGRPEVDFGSPHGAELAFVFGHPEGWPDLYGDTVPRPLVDQMMDMWIAFAHTGDPNDAGVAEWPPYQLPERATMVFDTTQDGVTSAVVHDPDAQERAFWEAIPFDGVTPSQ